MSNPEETKNDVETNTPAPAPETTGEQKQNDDSGDTGTGDTSGEPTDAKKEEGAE